MISILIAAVLVLMGGLSVDSVSAHVVPSPCDFTTGGGYVFKDDGAMVNFGIVGGCKNGGFYGHVNVVDHDTNGLHINGPVTMYLEPFSGSFIRDLCGTDTKTGAKFRVRTIDAEHSGGTISKDEFGVALSTGYTVTTRHLGRDLGPGGGDIELHKPNPSNTGGTADESQCAGEP
jgi:hypothetical protein